MHIFQRMSRCLMVLLLRLSAATVHSRIKSWISVLSTQIISTTRWTVFHLWIRFILHLDQMIQVPKSVSEVMWLLLPLLSIQMTSTIHLFLWWHPHLTKQKRSMILQNGYKLYLIHKSPMNLVQRPIVLFGLLLVMETQHIMQPSSKYAWRRLLRLFLILERFSILCCDSICLPPRMESHLLVIQNTYSSYLLLCCRVLLGLRLTKMKSNQS